MGQIFVVVLAEVCSKEVEQLHMANLAMERFANFSNEVTEGWSSVREEEERVQPNP